MWVLPVPAASRCEDVNESTDCLRRHAAPPCTEPLSASDPAATGAGSVARSRQFLHGRYDRAPRRHACVRCTSSHSPKKNSAVTVAEVTTISVAIAAAAPTLPASSR